MRYLVTGGAGFIGSHLSETLLSQGNEVVVMDDLSTGQIRNIEPLKGHPRFRYIIDSIKNKPLLYEIMDGCDVVFHLAAAVGVRLIMESPVYTIETNINGTELVLECASRKGKTVVIASTSEVYGKANKIPFSEEDDLVLGTPKKARWSYACSKAIDEFLGLAYWKEKKVPVVIARLFNTVGPRQTGRYGMVLPSFVQQALKGNPITVYGDGTQSRSFTWVGDAVRAMISLCHHPGAVGEIFNIGSSTEITIQELAEMVKDVTGSSSEIVYISYDQAYEEGFEDMKRRVPDIRKIQNLIGYQPTKELREIIEDICRDFNKRPLGIAG